MVSIIEFWVYTCLSREKGSSWYHHGRPGVARNREVQLLGFGFAIDRKVYLEYSLSDTRNPTFHATAAIRTVASFR
jgi:hypothetical protein